MLLETPRIGWSPAAFIKAVTRYMYGPVCGETKDRISLHRQREQLGYAAASLYAHETLHTTQVTKDDTGDTPRDITATPLYSFSFYGIPRYPHVITINETGGQC